MKKNMNRVTVICLGVIDMKKSLQFYRDKLGFKTDETGDNPDVVFFSTPGTKLELYPLDLLAKDIDPEQHRDFRRPRDGHPVWFVKSGRHQRGDDADQASPFRFPQLPLS